MNKLLLFILLLNIGFAQTENKSSSEITGLKELPEYVQKGDTEYIIRLIGGDIIRGYVDEFNFKDGIVSEIVFASQLGVGPIKLSKIEEITIYKDYYKHDHRAFLLPTAYPISGNHYLGAFELAMLYAGVGIYDYVSISGGRTIVPGIRQDQQISNLNIKATLYQTDWIETPGGMAIALGYNSAWINDNNAFQHFFGTISFKGERSVLTGSFFYKTGAKDDYDFRFMDQNINVVFEDGNYGIGLGLDSKLSNWNNVHFIGELWNGNISEPSNTGVLFGLRIFNGQFSADFGLAIFTYPIAAPFASFVWTPF
ncbi:hypothetical protein OAQ99_04400 [Candidatus Kapabacteria bacterium]|nr:hypothetical protein [Candidatus Kapabacteria bacterium]